MRPPPGPAWQVAAGGAGEGCGEPGEGTGGPGVWSLGGHRGFEGKEAAAQLAAWGVPPRKEPFWGGPPGVRPPVF